METMLNPLPTNDRVTRLSVRGCLRRAITALLLVLPLLTLSSPAGAMNIKSLFNDLCQYYVLDNDTCAAEVLVDCLVQTNGNMDAMLKCAGNYDPKAKKFIDIYFAAKKPDYVKFIELAGPVVACQAALLPPGPPKNILCGELMQPIAKLGFSTAAQFYQAAVDKNWPKLVYLAGPGLGCKALDLVGGIPGKELLCGTVAKIIEEGVELAKKGLGAGQDALEYGAGAIMDGAEALSDLLGGGSGKPLMSEEEYYRKVVRPWLHERVLKRVAYNQQALGLSQPQMKNCIAYYPVIFYKGRCDNLSKRLHNEADAFSKVVVPAPAAHFATRIKPLVGDLGAEQYWGGVEAYKKFVNTLPMKNWHPGSFWVGTDKGIATLMLDCQKEMIQKFPVPLAPGVTDALTPSSFWNWVCYQSIGKQLSAALVAEKQRLDQQVKPKIQNAGCQVQKMNSATLYFKCGTYSAHDTCQQTFSGYRYTHCSVDKGIAEKGLAQKIAQALGAKRCSYEEKTGMGLSPAVRCTRPYKQETCKLMVAQHKSASGGTSGTHVQCLLQEDEAFMSGLKKAKALLKMLNGVTSMPVTVIESGETKTIQMALTPGCSTTWDPLALTCEKSEAFTALAQKEPKAALDACLPDLQRDGADAPCRVVPLRAFRARQPARAERLVAPLPGLKQGIVAAPGVSVTDRAVNPALSRALVPRADTAPSVPARGGITTPATDAQRKSPAAPVPANTGKLAGLARGTAAARADIVAGDALVIGNTPARWGSNIAIGPDPARGSCEFPVRYNARNNGAVASAAFGSAWRNSALPGNVTRAWAPLAPGVESTQTDIITLKPGQNVLSLALDHLNQVPETDENNNRVRIVINLTGSCGGTATMERAPAAPVKPAPRGRLNLPTR